MNKVKIMFPLVPKITRNVYREMNEHIITLGESTISVLALPSGTFEVTEIFNEEEFEEEFEYTYFKDNLEDVAELVNILLITAHGNVAKVTSIRLL